MLIHDGVRPIIDSDLIERNISTAMQHGNAISAAKVIETVFLSDNAKVGDVVYNRYVGGFRRNITLNVNGQEVEAVENLYCVLNEVKTFEMAYFDEKSR